MEVDFRRWGAFNLVGLCGFAVQIGAIAVLTRGVGWSPFFASVIALELAALQNFLVHSAWTWRERRAATVMVRLRRYARYQLAKTASLVTNLAITTWLVHGGMPAEAANAAAVLVCTIPNYLVSERFVFRPPPRRQTPDSRF